MDIIKGKTTAAELARSHDLTVAEVEKWMDDFVSQGTEALRSHPRDAEAKHRAEKKDLLAKIGDLTMQMEAYKDRQGLPRPGKTSARRGLVTHVHQALRASGHQASVSKVCDWFDFPRSTAYSQPRETKPRPIDVALAARIKPVH